MNTHVEEQLKVVMRSVMDTNMFNVPCRMVSAENVFPKIHTSAARTSGEFLREPQRWRKRQQWSSWQVEEEKTDLDFWNSVESHFFVRVELVAIIVLRSWVVPFGGEHKSVGSCIWKPRLWSLTRLLVACLFTL